ncbi:uncharacterized protein FIBRA_08301 [Fibroporia radiculosa]|uniref:Uncharacterized protein n=1 Tax=Fibroporia radiculosa TaxID=599839 RepID=J4H536_9APHY|nr:uncharacterized protein FIBRA_08301 [Fibroporia radiculosa]CCM06054.1 predicted protein [Fibroporia radiculosa]
MLSIRAPRSFAKKEKRPSLLKLKPKSPIKSYADAVRGEEEQGLVWINPTSVGTDASGNCILCESFNPCFKCMASCSTPVRPGYEPPHAFHLGTILDPLWIDGPCVGFGHRPWLCPPGSWGKKTNMDVFKDPAARQVPWVRLLERSTCKLRNGVSSGPSSYPRSNRLQNAEDSAIPSLTFSSSLDSGSPSIPAVLNNLSELHAKMGEEDAPCIVYATGNVDQQTILGTPLLREKRAYHTFAEFERRESTHLVRLAAIWATVPPGLKKPTLKLSDIDS